MTYEVWGQTDGRPLRAGHHLHTERSINGYGWAGTVEIEGAVTVTDSEAHALLLKRRAAARAARDFVASDALRDELAALGVEVRDTVSGQETSLRR